MSLIAEFKEGWNASQPDLDNPYIWSSDCWLAFMAGADFYRHGTSEAVKARKSRGNVIRVETAGGTEFRVIYDRHYRFQRIERV